MSKKRRRKDATLVCRTTILLIYQQSLEQISEIGRRDVRMKGAESLICETVLLASVRYPLLISIRMDELVFKHTTRFGKIRF